VDGISLWESLCAVEEEGVRVVLGGVPGAAGAWRTGWLLVMIITMMTTTLVMVTMMMVMVMRMIMAMTIMAMMIIMMATVMMASPPLPCPLALT
jgi:hypothetical protein